MVESAVVYQEILESGHFKADWYLCQYQDVATAGQDPLEHYLKYGVDEGRDPGPDFSTSGYLARYRDVAEAGINPLLHYIRYGKKEGRRTTACLDPGAVKRPYGNFGAYLTYSLLDPVVKAPFATVDLHNFEQMDQVAQWLCLKQKEYKAAPLISVIMPMRNRADVVGDAIHSVLEQSYPNFELIVVDDGSADNSFSVAQGFGDQRIRVIENDRSAGVSAARNRGLAMARGALIAYLDSDNTWRADYLSAMAGFFQVRPDADAAYGGQYLYRGMDNQPFAVRFGCFNPSLLRNRNFIDLNCFVHRREILEAVGGGFCEEIRRWVDWELVLRIARAGRIYSVPILQSNYFLEKVDNTISVTEMLQPARQAIMTQWGYEGDIGPATITAPLSRKVAVVVSERRSTEDPDAIVSSLMEHWSDPRVEVLVAAVSSLSDSDGEFDENGSTGVKRTAANSGRGVWEAVKRAAHNADPDSDLIILKPNAILTPHALSALQKAACEDDSIAIAVPQQVFPAEDPAINIHVPYAFNDVPCDITLSHRHTNVEALPLFHDGGKVDLNFASFFCAYIKRDVWELCRGLAVRQDRHFRFDRIFCEFVRHVLGRRIVYTPEAVVWKA